MCVIFSLFANFLGAKHKTALENKKYILQMCLRIQFCIHIQVRTLIFSKNVKILVPFCAIYIQAFSTPKKVSDIPVPSRDVTA
jgi:hypothetical protein